jgi:hypothetical protein
VTGRQKAYYGIRGAAVLVFLLAALVMPSGLAAGLAAGGAGVVGLLTCIAVNAGGPGERAGAVEQGVRYERTRAPQGDWPPYPEDKVVEGEIVTDPERRPE